MYDVNEFKLGSEVSFSIHGNIGGRNNYTGEVVSVISGAHVPAEANAFANHANIYPSLPEEVAAVVEDNFNTYHYVLLSVDGKMVYVGLPWIRASSLSTVETVTRTIVVQDSHNDALRLTQVLRSNGYTVISSS